MEDYLAVNLEADAEGVLRHHELIRDICWCAGRHKAELHILVKPEGIWRIDRLLKLHFPLFWVFSKVYKQKPSDITESNFLGGFESLGFHIGEHLIAVIQVVFVH